MTTNYMSEQEQEHMDHVAGSASEFQNSHAQSQIENNAREYATGDKATRLTALGMHVVLSVVPAYCRVTDGIIGVHSSIMGAFPSLESAEAFIAMYVDKHGYDEECTYGVRSPLLPPTKKCFVRHISEPEPETSREQREADECPF